MQLATPFSKSPFKPPTSLHLGAADPLSSRHGSAPPRNQGTWDAPTWPSGKTGNMLKSSEVINRHREVCRIRKWIPNAVGTHLCPFKRETTSCRETFCSQSGQHVRCHRPMPMALFFVLFCFLTPFLLNKIKRDLHLVIAFVHSDEVMVVKPLQTRKLIPACYPPVLSCG